MAAARRCASCRSLLASLLFIAMMANFALAAVAKAAGDPDPDRANEQGGGGGGGFDPQCPLECSTKLTGYIMETVKCYVACMGGGGGGGGGGGLSAADQEEMRSTPRLPSSCEGGRVVVVGDASWGDSLVTITACIQPRKSGGAPSVDKILQ